MSTFQYCEPCGTEENPCAITFLPPAPEKGKCQNGKDFIKDQVSHVVFGLEGEVSPFAINTPTGFANNVDNVAEDPTKYRCIEVIGDITNNETEKEIGGCKKIKIKDDSVLSFTRPVTLEEYNAFWSKVEDCVTNIVVYPIIGCKVGKGLEFMQDGVAVPLWAGYSGTISVNLPVGGNDEDCLSISGEITFDQSCAGKLFPFCG